MNLTTLGSDIANKMFDNDYSGGGYKYALMGPSAMRSMLSAPDARKQFDCRSRAYRLGKKRPWWSGGGYPLSTCELVFDKMPKIKVDNLGLDIKKYVDNRKSKIERNRRTVSRN